jgi:hypothetical protein
MFQTNVVEKIAAHILCSVTDFQDRAFYGIKWKKYCRVIQNTKENMANAPCVLDT